MEKICLVLLLLATDVVCVVLDQVVIKKTRGKPLGWVYYLYVVVVTLLAATLICIN